MITPLRNQLLVALKPNEAPPTASGIQVQRLERAPATRATVLAIGEDVRDVPLNAHVVISRLQGIEVGGELLLIPESAVLAAVPDDHSCSQCGGTLDYENNCIAGCVP